MKLAFAMWLLAPVAALAAGCQGAEAQLRAIDKALDLVNFAEADRLLANVEASHPDCPEVMLDRARLRAGREDAPAAASLFSQYTDLAPKDARGYYYFARFLFAQRDYPRADTMSATAVSLRPEYADALALQGQLLGMKGQTDRAIETLQKACSLDPSNAEAHFQLGALFDRAKRNIDAVEHFEKAVALNPRDPRAWDYLALNLEPLGEIDRAEAAYKKGLAVNQGPRFDAFLDYNYGRFLLKRNRPAESKQHLDRAVELSPQTRAVVYERAKVNFRLHDDKAARADAEKALALPDRAGIIIELQIYVLLEQIYRRLGETELAQRYAELSRTTPVPPRSQRR